MKYVLVLLVLALFVFNAWFVIQESYWCVNLFISTKEIGIGFAGDFGYYYDIAKKLDKGESIYNDKRGIATYPPSFYLLFIPFTKMKNVDAFGNWIILKLICICMSAGILAYLILKNQGGFLRWLIAAILLSMLIYIFSPTQDDLVFGQINIIILFLLSLSLYLAETNKFIICGIVLGLIFSLKLFSLFFIVYFILKKNWRVVIPAFITIILINLPIIVRFGFGIYLDYFKYLILAKDRWISNHNFSLYTQFSIIFHNLGIKSFDLIKSLSNIAYVIISILILAGLYYIIILENKKENYFAIFPQIILATLFLSPYHWPLHHIWLFIPFAYIARQILTEKKSRVINIIGLLFIFFSLSFCDGTSGVGKWWWLKKIFLDSRAPLLLLVILWIQLTYNLVMEKRELNI